MFHVAGQLLFGLRSPRSLLLRCGWPLLLLATSLPGCDDDGGAGEEEGAPSIPCNGSCLAGEECIIGAAGEEQCIRKECDLPDRPCGDPSLECVNYKCLGLPCDGEGVCGPTYFCNRETHRCSPGCNVAGSCPAGQYCNLARHQCLAGCEADGCPVGQLCDLQRRTCLSCECMTDRQCDPQEYCEMLDSGGDCTCYRGCRHGEGSDSCDVPGERCDPATRRCRDWTCSGHGQCYATEYCDLTVVPGRCRAGCRDDGACQAGMICYEHGCRAGVRCLDDLECNEQLPGTHCDQTADPPLCRAIPCPGGDADCPVQPRLYFCNDLGECELGQCRVDLDCGDPWQKCTAFHTCVRKSCTSNEECAPTEYCDLVGEEGLCRPGCWKHTQCAAEQPCRAADHQCGCLGDADCGVLEAQGAELVCELGSCVPACRLQTDCPGMDRFCDPSGHCRSGCAPDRQEPNESRDEATLLELVEDPVTQTASFLADKQRLCGGPLDGDTDWYVLELRAGDALTVEVDWASCDAGQLRLSLWRAEREDQEDGTVTADGRCRISYLGRPVAEAGFVYLQLEALAPVEVDYLLRVTVARAFRCMADAREPNDHAEQPAAIAASPCVASLTLCTGDEDWFAIPVHQRDQLTVDLTYDESRGAIQAQLYSPQPGVPPLATGFGEQGRLRLLLDGNRTVLDGDYLLHVQPLTQGLETPETSYSCCWQVTPYQPPCDLDLLEPNGSREEARNLFGGRLDPGEHYSVIHSHLALCALDEDWYFVEVAAPSTLHLIVTNDTGPEENLFLEVTLFDEKNDELLTSAASGPENRIDADLLVGGRFLVRVRHPAGREEDSVVDYQVTVNVTVGEAGGCAPDRLEPNDLPVQATPLAVVPGRLFEELNLGICNRPRQLPDEDWYAIDLRNTNPALLRVAVRFAAADGDLDLWLRDGTNPALNPCFVPSQCESTGEDDDEQILLQRPAGGLYLARVFGFSGAQNSYDLEVEVELAAACPEDGYEENDQLAQAELLPTDPVRAYRGQLCQGDEDWFQVFPRDGRDLKIHLFSHFMNGDIDLQVLDERGLLVGQSSQSSSNEECVVVPQPPANSPYYIRIYSQGGRVDNDYELTPSTGVGLSCD